MAKMTPKGAKLMLRRIERLGAKAWADTTMGDQICLQELSGALRRLGFGEAVDEYWVAREAARAAYYADAERKHQERAAVRASIRRDALERLGS